MTTTTAPATPTLDAAQAAVDAACDKIAVMAGCFEFTGTATAERHNAGIREFIRTTLQPELDAALAARDYYADLVDEPADVDELPCHDCTREAGGDVFGDDHPMRAVVSERVNRDHRDPTTVYGLACGHSVI